MDITCCSFDYVVNTLASISIVVTLISSVLQTTGSLSVFFHGYPSTLEWEGYWQWWECTGLLGLGTGTSVHLFQYGSVIMRIIILGFGFILIKPKLYFRIKILHKISHSISVKPCESYCACVIRTFSPYNPAESRFQTLLFQLSLLTTRTHRTSLFVLLAYYWKV